MNIRKNLIVTILLIGIFTMIFPPIIAKASPKWSALNNTMYANSGILIYKKATIKSKPVDVYNKGNIVIITAVSSDNQWYKVKKDKVTGYIKCKNKLVNRKPCKLYKGKRLNMFDGTINGPSGRESYYNLPMKKVVKHMRRKGYKASKYPYWIRKDGCKMLGPYIIVSANLKIRKRGSLVETSLGTGIVCDTGSFISSYPRGLDIAVDWK